MVVGVSDIAGKVERAMAKADKLETKELEAGTAEIEKDAATED